MPPARLASPGPALPRFGRALWLEFKRNAVPYVLPLLAAVFYFNTVRTANGYPAVWTVRASVIDNDMVFEFGAFAAGLAAWAGSREGRRKTADLVATTSRAVWARQSVALAGTLCWMLLAFLAGVAVLYIQTALQATWGGPPLWPVFVGVAGVTVTTVIGFTAGVFFPGRFTAPLAAILVFVLSDIGFREALSLAPGSGTYALLSPSNSVPLVDSGIYYRVAPDVSIVQVMFMGGIALALFGVLGLASGLRELASAGGIGALRAGLSRAGGWLPRAVAVVLTGCGVAAAVTAFVLAGTAQPDQAGGNAQAGAALFGWEIPALHSAASDQPLPVTQDCTSTSGFRVCVNQAFSSDLGNVAAIVDPVGAAIAGLPGAPVGVEEVASMNAGLPVMSRISGNPPVFIFTAEHVGDLFGEFNGYDPVGWREGFQQGLLSDFLEEQSQQSGPVSVPLDAAQQAVENGLLTAIGSPPSTTFGGMNVNGKVTTPQTAAEVAAATQRFAALSASARHAWLATHLAALRAGTITVAQVP
ncbi:MAG: hypothetical protein ACRDNO_24795 [Trebonia sp.]